MNRNSKIKAIRKTFVWAEPYNSSMLSVDRHLSASSVALDCRTFTRVKPWRLTASTIRAL